MSAEQCTATNRFMDDVMHCTLPADHTTPTDAQPQGSPHEDSGYLDVLDGKPSRWWG